MASVFQQPQNKECACEMVALQVSKMSKSCEQQECMWIRTRRSTRTQRKANMNRKHGEPRHLSLTNPTLPERTTRKSPRQHNNQFYAWCHGVLSVRSPNLCLLSSHVGVHLSVLQQSKNMIKKKITMSIRHAIGARWRPTKRGDARQCPNARFKHAADHVAFELLRSSITVKRDPVKRPFSSPTRGIQTRK